MPLKYAFTDLMYGTTYYAKITPNNIHNDVSGKFTTCRIRCDVKRNIVLSLYVQMCEVITVVYEYDLETKLESSLITN